MMWCGSAMVACGQLESLQPSYLMKAQAICVSAVLLQFSKMKAVFPFPYLRFFFCSSSKDDNELEMLSSFRETELLWTVLL